MIATPSYWLSRCRMRWRRNAWWDVPQYSISRSKFRHRLRWPGTRVRWFPKRTHRWLRYTEPTVRFKEHLTHINTIGMVYVERHQPQILSTCLYVWYTMKHNICSTIRALHPWREQKILFCLWRLIIISRWVAIWHNLRLAEPDVRAGRLKVISIDFVPLIHRE